MPQTKAAAKALRSSQKKRAGNDKWRRQIREAFYAVRDAVNAKDKATATQAAQKAASILDRAARRHVIHRNKAARKKSQLSKTVAAIK
jgi:small subunit ribosomal protein S20